MRRLTLLAAVVVVALTLAASAAADPTGESRPAVHATVEMTVTTPDFTGTGYPNCPAFGYSFKAAPTFHVVRRSILFYDDSGLQTPAHLLREIRHVDFEGYIHKSTDPTKSVPYAGTWTIHFDYEANVVSQTGLFRVSHPGGGGVLAMSAGRQLRMPPDELKPPSGIAPIEWERAVCAYLATL